jgi:catalase
VLYDSVVVLGSKQGRPLLAPLPAARNFLTDAFAHCKFIGFTGDAAPLFEAAGLAGLLDDGFADLGQLSAADFLSRCSASVLAAPGQPDREGRRRTGLNLTAREGS